MNKKIKKILSKKNKSKIVCLTAYSKNIAEILDKHCDLVLVGDSLGSVLYSYKSTKEVTLQTMINHWEGIEVEGFWDAECSINPSSPACLLFNN